MTREEYVNFANALKNNYTIDFDKLPEFCDMAISLLEENNREWTPVSSGELPKEPYACLVTVWDTNILTQEEFENILHYPVGYDGETWNDGDGNICPYEVIAWMPAPKPYKVESEEI